MVRDSLDGREWAAVTQVTLATGGLSRVELLDGEESIADLKGPPWQAQARFTSNGEHELVAVGYDASGKEVLRAKALLSVAAPRDEGCTSKLGALGLKWRPAKATRGISEPVIIDPPTIEGVTFRPWQSAKATPMLLACQMAIHVHELAQMLKKVGVEEVLTMGIYNYRKMRNPKCIATNSCPLSQHAFGTAVDIHEVRLNASALKASVERDWVIDKTVPVCPGKPKNESDRVLHQIACGMFDRRIFNVVLTPNYNDSHRNHFHVDLTASWSGIRGEDLGIDPAVEGLGD